MVLAIGHVLRAHEACVPLLAVVVIKKGSQIFEYGGRSCVVWTGAIGFADFDCTDPVTMRYYPNTKSRQEAEEWVRRVRESYRDNGFGLWAAILKDSGEFAGQCGLTVQEVGGKNEIEIGYLFLRRFWGRGLATEAARSARDHGFNMPGCERLVSLIDPGNLASRRVAEKVGLTQEKEVEKWGKRICVYAIRKGSLATKCDPAE